MAEPSFSGRVSVSVADDGETAVVISLVEGNQTSQQSGKTSAEFSKDMDNKLLSSYNTEALPDYRNSFKTESCQQEAEIYLSRQNCHTALHLLPPSELKKYSDDAVERASTHSNNMTESGLALDLGISMGSEPPNPILWNCPRLIYFQFYDWSCYRLYFFMHIFYRHEEQ